jgi:hypothetical protein
MFSSLKPVPIKIDKSMGLLRRHECCRGEHRGARGLIPGMTAQGPPTSLRQAARPRSQRRWPLAPGHWAELGVACGGSVRSAGIEVNSDVQTYVIYRYSCQRSRSNGGLDENGTLDERVAPSGVPLSFRLLVKPIRLIAPAKLVGPGSRGERGIVLPQTIPVFL